MCSLRLRVSSGLLLVRQSFQLAKSRAGLLIFSLARHLLASRMAHTIVSHYGTSVILHGVPVHRTPGTMPRLLKPSLTIRYSSSDCSSGYNRAQDAKRYSLDESCEHRSLSLYPRHLRITEDDAYKRTHTRTVN